MNSEDAPREPARSAALRGDDRVTHADRGALRVMHHQVLTKEDVVLPAGLLVAKELTRSEGAQRRRRLRTRDRSAPLIGVVGAEHGIARAAPVGDAGLLVDRGHLAAGTRLDDTKRRLISTVSSNGDRRPLVLRKGAGRHPERPALAAAVGGPDDQVGSEPVHGDGALPARFEPGIELCE